MTHQPFATHQTFSSSAIQPKSSSDPLLLDAFGREGNFIREHFRRILSLPVTAMVAVFVVYAFFTKILLATLIEALPFFFLLDDPNHKAVSTTAMVVDKGVLSTFITIIIIAPLFETLFNQWLPIWLSGKLQQKPVFAIWLSTMFFGLCHLHAGQFGFWMSAPVGFYLAVAFAHGRQLSRARAYWTTTGIHSALNGIALSLALLTG